MAKKNEIVHAGRILEITPDFTTVQIIVSSACSSCHAKGLCGMSEEEEKVIMLPTDPYATYNVGGLVGYITNSAYIHDSSFAGTIIPPAPLTAFSIPLWS